MLRGIRRSVDSLILRFGVQRPGFDSSSRPTQNEPVSAADRDLRWLRRAIELSAESVAAGDYAFGTVVVDADGSVLAEATQTVATSGDPLGHAEMNALRQLFPERTREELAGATLYSSTEPCPMCSGAIAWCMNRLVFGLSQASMYDLDPAAAPRFEEPWDSRQLFAAVRPFDVVGPLLEQEAADVHRMWLLANPTG
jgi:tRNA(Arg) A34 adenosine deaminase TadA